MCHPNGNCKLRKFAQKVNSVMYNFNLMLIYNFRFNVTPIMSGGSMSTNLKLYNFYVDKDFSFVSYPQFYEKKEKNLFLQINSKVRNCDKITVNKTIAPHFLKKVSEGTDNGTFIHFTVCAMILHYVYFQHFVRENKLGLFIFFCLRKKYSRKPTFDRSTAKQIYIELSAPKWSEPELK